MISPAEIWGADTLHPDDFRHSPDKLMLALLRLDTAGRDVMRRAVIAMAYAHQRGWKTLSRVDATKQRAKSRGRLSKAAHHD